MARQMCRTSTPVEYHPDLGLWVKREDRCCPGGPHFSKTRGVFAHVRSRPEPIIGVLDTAHSQAGWAVAKACKLLDKHCVNYYPVRKSEDPNVLKKPQAMAEELGAGVVPLQAGRSAILYHQAKKDLDRQTNNDSYMMPNALKLEESVEETAREFVRTDLPDVGRIIVPASSATIAAGVVLGASRRGWDGWIVVHLGYSRSQAAVEKYVQKASGVVHKKLLVVDEGYSYADEARPGPDVPWPCDKFYDLKAARWWLSGEREGEALLWNIG